MNIALCYCQKDRSQAERLAEWLLHLGPFPRHSFLIFRHADAEPIAAFEQFAAGEWPIADDVFNSWPQSANHAFKKVGKHVEYTSAKPFLWLEPDAVPLDGRAFDLIEAEYLRLGKPFLGDIINDGKGFVPHMSGIGVYPGSISNFAGEIYFAGSDPFDIYAAAAVLPQAAQSELILHQWKGAPFTSRDELNTRIFSLRPKCVLFHSDKSGSLIELLRGHDAAVPDPLIDAAGTIQPLPEPPPPSPPTIVEPPPLPAALQASVIKAPDYWIGQKPWENKVESMAEIKLLAKRLSEFCGVGARSRFVLIALHDEKIIKLSYRKKARGRPRKTVGGFKRKPGAPTRAQVRLEARKERERRERVTFPEADCIFCLEPRPKCTCAPGTF